MPSIVSNQIYRSGETPIFLAFLYGVNREPLTFYQEGDEDIAGYDPDLKVKSITVTHSHRRDGIINGFFTTAWYPVTHPTGIFENVFILSSHILDVPVNITDTDILKRVQKPTELTERFAISPANGRYNFVYIPLNGRYFYPNDGLYRTIFHMELMNGKTDMVIMESDVYEYLDNNPENPILKKYVESVGFGEKIIFTGDLYGLYKEDDGGLMFISTDNDQPIIRDQTILDNIAEVEEELAEKLAEIKEKEDEVALLIEVFDEMSEEDRESPAGVILQGNIQVLLDEIKELREEEAEIRQRLRGHINKDMVSDVYLTVSSVETHQKIIDREPIGTDVLRLQVVSASPFNYNFRYEFYTNRLPREGRYKFQFEIETRGNINPFGVEGNRGIPCTFDIDVMVN